MVWMSVDGVARRVSTGGTFAFAEVAPVRVTPALRIFVLKLHARDGSVFRWRSSTTVEARARAEADHWLDADAANKSSLVLLGYERVR